MYSSVGGHDVKKKKKMPCFQRLVFLAACSFLLLTLNWRRKPPSVPFNGSWLSDHARESSPGCWSWGRKCVPVRRLHGNVRHVLDETMSTNYKSPLYIIFLAWGLGLWIRCIHSLPTLAVYLTHATTEVLLDGLFWRKYFLNRYPWAPCP